MTKEQVISKMKTQVFMDGKINEVGNIVATIELTPAEFNALVGYRAL